MIATATTRPATTTASAGLVTASLPRAQKSRVTPLLKRRCGKRLATYI